MKAALRQTVRGPRAARSPCVNPHRAVAAASTVLAAQERLPAARPRLAPAGPQALQRAAARAEARVLHSVVAQSRSAGTQALRPGAARSRSVWTRVLPGVARWSRPAATQALRAESTAAQAPRFAAAIPARVRRASMNDPARLLEDRARSVARNAAPGVARGDHRGVAQRVARDVARRGRAVRRAARVAIRRLRAAAPSPQAVLAAARDVSARVQ